MRALSNLLLCPRWALRVLSACLGALLCALTVCGCVTTYQPLSGLQRPVAIDDLVANFEGVDLTVICLPGPVRDNGEADKLCRKLQQYFENQGAVVKTRTTRGIEDDDDDLPPPPPPRAGVRPSSLELRLSARMLYEDVTDWIFFDHRSEYIFAEDIELRDGEGFLLLRDTLIGRFEKQLLFADSTGRDFSRDYYNQVGQLTLNAKVRQHVLREVPPPPVGKAGP